MTRFCASCTEERDDLVAEWLDGKLVLLCRECSLGEIRGGRWSFNGGREVSGPRGIGGDGNLHLTRRGPRGVVR